MTVLWRNSLKWYGYVLWKDKNSWLKKTSDYEVESVRPRGWPKKPEERMWRKIVRLDN